MMDKKCVAGVLRGILKGVELGIETTSRLIIFTLLLFLANLMAAEGLINISDIPILEAMFSILGLWVIIPIFVNVFSQVIPKKNQTIRKVSA